jgi:hypothetical protein
MLQIKRSRSYQISGRGEWVTKSIWDPDLEPRFGSFMTPIWDTDLEPQFKIKKVNVEATIHNSHFGKMILISYHIILKIMIYT